MIYQQFKLKNNYINLVRPGEGGNDIEERMPCNSKKYPTKGKTKAKSVKKTPKKK